MDAEVLIDAINKYRCSDLIPPHPGAFHLYSPGQACDRRSDGSITSPFLACLVVRRGPRAWPTNATTSPSRPSGCTLLNSSHIQLKLDQGPKLKAIFESGRKPNEIVEELYLTILSVSRRRMR